VKSGQRYKLRNYSSREWPLGVSWEEEHPMPLHNQLKVHEGVTAGELIPIGPNKIKNSDLCDDNFKAPSYGSVTRRPNP
jgi:hypothetical protein